MALVRVPLRILVCLLRPPWGMLLLTTGLILFLLILFGKKHWDKEQSDSLFSQLQKSNINQKEIIASQLTQFDEVGIRLLIRGLASKEESTVLACHQTLKQLLFEWQCLSNEQVSSRYLVVSKELVEISKNGTLYSLLLAHELAVMVQNDIVNRGIEGQRLVSQHCQKVIDAWQAGQRDQTTGAKFNQQNEFHTTLVSAGEPKNVRVAGINVPYLVAQPVNTETNDRLHQLTDESGLLPHNGVSGIKSPTAQSPPLATSPRVGFYSLHSPVPASVPAKKDQVLIASDQPKVSPFLTGHLQLVALPDLPRLPTQDLMRLLNHTNQEIAQQSETILKKRDGFQEDHIQLARKLYHPDASARKSLLPQLAENDQLETCNWLSELLKDPDQGVRLATARAISSQIPLDDDERERLKRIMQLDADQRIAALGQGLETRVY